LAIILTAKDTSRMPVVLLAASKECFYAASRKVLLVPATITVADVCASITIAPNSYVTAGLSIWATQKVSVFTLKFRPHHRHLPPALANELLGGTLNLTLTLIRLAGGDVRRNVYHAALLANLLRRA